MFIPESATAMCGSLFLRLSVSDQNPLQRPVHAESEAVAFPVPDPSGPV